MTRKLSCLAIALLGCIAGRAGTIYTTPTGLTPGTQYQLIFVTSDTTLATSTTIGDYNTFVTTEAALNSTLAAFDSANSVTWTVIGSTPSVSATTNAPSTGLVYNLENTEVASSGVYGGTLLAPVGFDENGTASANAVWTGSTTSGGMAGGINDLGQTFPEYGFANLATAGWIADTNGIESDNGLSLYAISSVLTVPQASTTPEPGTLGLTACAALLLGIFTARQSKPLSFQRPNPGTACARNQA
jgi:hypothetical protein